MVPIVKAISTTPRCTVGGGDYWDPEKGELLYVDAFESAVHRYVPKTDKTYTVNLGEIYSDSYNSLAIPVEGQTNSFIITQASHIKLMKWDGESSEPTSLKIIHTVQSDHPGYQFRHGKCDAMGRLWAGTVYPKAGFKPNPRQCSLYSFEGNGKVVEHLSQVGLSSGLSWNPDYTIFYHIDSLEFKISAYDYDMEKGTLHYGRTVFDFKETNTPGFPNGMTTDCNGNLWIACGMAGYVINIDPLTGRKLNQIDFPVNSPTTVAFGGPDLETLYVTTAALSLIDGGRDEDHPDAGKLFTVTNLGVKGCTPAANFKGRL